MLNRYIGNKKKILDPLVHAISSHARQGELVCDIFSGSMAVALELKRCGFRVAANDINLFSAMYGRAFLTNVGVPAMPRLSSRGTVGTTSGTANAIAHDDALSDFRDELDSISSAIAYLNETDDSCLPGWAQRTDFYDHYCEDGSKSDFVSSRGSKGRRRFFTASNARRLDVVVNHLRWWLREGYIDESAYALLVCQLLDAVEKVSNTQGTYHDFPRNVYDPRAMGRLTMEMPDYSGLVQNTGPHILGIAEDSLDFIKRVPHHRVLYVDPPYNFRQYTAYYFMPNLISAYGTIPDLDQYFSEIDYVRGQNPNDDFSSSFSRRSTFIESLTQLLKDADADTVVVSYFNGANHWRDFKTGAASGSGALPLESLMSGLLFVEGSYSITPVKRLNYQSYGGFTAKYVDELLLTARKTGGVAGFVGSGDGLDGGPGWTAIQPVA